uniref:Relaxin receptor 1-like n=1 Tax=Petromyzon marinus TaxID=7757 RepID=A0AAJ7UHY5_PETMA
MLDHNALAHVTQATFTGLPSLVFLYLLNNSLTELPRLSLCKEMPRLNWLDLESNRIKDVRNSTFMGCEQLTVLILRDNRIQALAERTFNPLLNLGDLDLSRNLIERLPRRIFNDLRNLQQLNISFNPLRRIHVEQFAKLKQLRSLSLEGIEIENIRQEMFWPLRELEHIYFSHFHLCSHAPLVRGCRPPSDGVSSLQHLLAPAPLRGLVWLVALATCAGNVAVACARTCVPAENPGHALSIKNLCCADGLMGVYLLAIGVCDARFRGDYNRHAHAWTSSNACRLLGALAVLSTEVSVLLLAALTLERFACIVFPFSSSPPPPPPPPPPSSSSSSSSSRSSSSSSSSSWSSRSVPASSCRRGGRSSSSSSSSSRRRTQVSLAVAWLGGSSLALGPLLVGGRLGDDLYGRNGVCFPLHADRRPGGGGGGGGTAKVYSDGVLLGVNLIAFLVILLCYSSMFWSLRGPARGGGGGAGRGVRRSRPGVTAVTSGRARRDLGVARRFFFIVLTDALCWIPIFVLKALALLSVDIPGTMSSWVVIFILPINSALNPLLYTLTTRHFRQRAAVALRRWSTRLARPGHATSTSSTSSSST